MKELLNIGQALGRDEMKKLMAGTGGSCGTCSDTTFNGTSYVCWHNGCQVTLVQCSDGWVLFTCDGCWTGNGSYGGTICGGTFP